MKKKLAKIKYLPNNFQIIESGDYVKCAVSGKIISLDISIIGMLIYRSHTFLTKKHLLREKS